MSDLPSRDEFNRTGKGSVFICEAYAEGRLVDREAIDYEAAAIAWLGPKSAYEADPDAQRVAEAYEGLITAAIEQTIKPLFDAALGDL